MNSGSRSARNVLLASVLLGWVPQRSVAQQAREPTHVLALQWYDRAYEPNLRFDQSLQAALRLYAPKEFTYYSEYLETNKFPGEEQSSLLGDYLSRKYARQHIDVLVARTTVALDYLIEHRASLFPNVPIVFAVSVPPSAKRMSETGATGIVYGNTHTRTLDLALRLHPGTAQVYVVSGTRTHDKMLEKIARQELQKRSDRLAIHYLTDVPPDELKARLATLPPRSVVLYVWQQVQLPHDKLMESQEVLGLIARGANSPIYGMSVANIGVGVVGGYVWTFEANAAKLAELIARVTGGEPAGDIPAVRAADVPMFDWRQLERWEISEDRLPPGSIVQFRNQTVWQLYKWRIVGIFVLLAVQALMIGGLLILWRRTRRSENQLRSNEAHLEALVEQRTAEFVKARDQAIRASRAKSAFLANMSHELRTPLNAILGFSAMVRAEPGLSDQVRKDLDVVERSGEHLVGLIDDVLDMAKIESGGMTVDNASFGLYALLKDTVNMFQERAHVRNLDLVLEVAPDVPRFVRSDAGKVRQVLTNLIGNAIKYTEEGSVLVRVSTHSGAPASAVLCLEVEDTGIGIAEQDKARIFEPFVQIGASTRKGTGLGLSITRHFVQLLGGTIQLDSALGRGSRFCAEIPVQLAEVSEIISPDAGLWRRVVALEPGQPTQRILVVEDQHENAQLLERLLHAVGFEVRVAEDGARAVDAFASWRPDFIWMDVRLPGLSGLEAAKRIRAMDGGHAVRIAAVTASAFDTERDQVLAAGFDDLLRKPFRQREIFDCMARHVGVRYVYAPEQEAETLVPATVRPEDLALLPRRLREELEAAILSLDQKRITQVVVRVSQQDRLVGSALQWLADNLTYSPILTALRGAARGRCRLVRHDSHR